MEHELRIGNGQKDSMPRSGVAHLGELRQQPSTDMTSCLRWCAIAHGTLEVGQL